MAGNQVYEQQQQQQQQPKRQETFKQKLDRVADERLEQRVSEANHHPNPVVEKITEYVPAAAKILGKSHKPTQAATDDNSGEVPGPPERPHHDDKIEDFVRDQHRSNKESDGTLRTADA